MLEISSNALQAKNLPQEKHFDGFSSDQMNLLN